MKSESSIALTRILGTLECAETGILALTFGTGEAAKSGNCNIAKSTIEKLILFIVLKFFLQISANRIKGKEEFIL